MLHNEIFSLVVEKNDYSMLTKAGHKYPDALLLKSKLIDNRVSIVRNNLVIILSSNYSSRAKSL